MTRIYIYILLLALAENVFAGEAKISFTAPNSANSLTIDLVFEGEVYGSENTYEAIKQKIKGSNGSYPIETFLLGFLEASKVPDKEKILSFWDKSEHQRISKMMDDPEMWEFNKKLFNSIQKSILMATMEMGDYTLAYVAHQYSGSDRLSEKVYPLKKVDDSFVLTNDLSNNSFFFRFSDLVADHLSQKVLKLED